jgi:hypothetical protein
MPNAAPRGGAAFGSCQLHFNCVVHSSVRFAAWCIDQYSYCGATQYSYCGALLTALLWCIHQYNCVLHSSLHLLRYNIHQYFCCCVSSYICCLLHSSEQELRRSLRGFDNDPRLLRLERVSWWALALHHQPSRNIMPALAEARRDRHHSGCGLDWGAILTLRSRSAANYPCCDKGRRPRRAR